jgi:hypothetical protein
MPIPEMPPQPPPLGVGPQPIQPIQPIQAPGAGTIDPDTLNALLSLQGPEHAATRSALKAAALREKSPTDAAEGPGPGGIRTGVGPGGWAVSLGDLVGGITNRFKQQELDHTSELNTGVADSLRRASAKQQQAQYDKMEALKAGVPQGTPMTSVLPQSAGGTGLLSL